MENQDIKIVETNYYLAEISAIIHKGQDEDELRDGIKEVIRKNPLIGDVIPRTNGVRKLRYAMPGKGKSGGYRIIYYIYNEEYPVYLMTIYAKSKSENLTPKAEKLFSAAAKELKNSFKKSR